MRGMMCQEKKVGIRQETGHAIIPSTGHDEDRLAVDDQIPVCEKPCVLSLSGSANKSHYTIMQSLGVIKRVG
jgi:hypothetical protein